MGVVYKARHLRLNRTVALKMIVDGKHARPEHRERFLIEAEAVARLRHPNIVQIYDIGEDEGRPFVTLEILEGGTLADRLKGTTQPSRAAAEMVATIALAMHAAHLSGIVHRDLKPSNILFDAEGIPKIVDFGLAKRLEVEEGQTETGQVMGTPSYMAPEQARGLTRLIGPPADIYSLGSILYEMLTGRPPFKGSSVMETLHQVIHDDVVSPSRLQPRMARDLATVCLKCLHKEPQKRYGSAAELADDLRRYLDGRPIRARRTPPWERGVKWVRRHPATATLISLAAAAIVILVAAGLRLDAQRRIKARTEDERVAGVGARCDRELFKAQALVAANKWAEAKPILTPLLTVLRPETRLSALERRTSDLLDQVERGIQDDRRHAEDHRRYELFRQRRNQAFFDQTQFTGLDLPTNLQAARASERAALRVFAEARQGDEWTLLPLPGSLSQSERTEIVEGCYELLLILAEAVAQALPGEDPKQQAERGLAVLDQAARVRPESTQAYHKLRARLPRASGRDAEGPTRETALADRLLPKTAADHFLAGQERFHHHDWTEAAGHFDAVLRLQPDHFWAQCLWSLAALQTGRPAEARVGLNLCLQREPGFAWLYLLRAYASGQVAALALDASTKIPAQAGDYKKGAENQFAAAESDYRTALEMLDRKPNDDFRYILLVNRGAMLYQSRRLEEAEADLQEAIRRNDRQYEAIATLAQVYRRQKKWDLAVEQFTRALLLNPDDPALFRERARVQQERDNPTAVHRDAELRDLDDAISREPSASPYLAGEQTRRADLLRRMHRYEEALAACDAAFLVLPGHVDAHRLRVMVLLDLKRYDEVMDSCDGALAQGKPWPDLHEIRGEARAGRQDFTGAIADYNLANGRPRPAAGLDLAGLDLPGHRRAEAGAGRFRGGAATRSREQRGQERPGFGAGAPGRLPRGRG